MRIHQRAPFQLWKWFYFFNFWSKLCENEEHSSSRCLICDSGRIAQHFSCWCCWELFLIVNFKLKICRIPCDLSRKLLRKCNLKLGKWKNGKNDAGIFQKRLIRSSRHLKSSIFWPWFTLSSRYDRVGFTSVCDLSWTDALRVFDVVTCSEQTCDCFLYLSASDALFVCFCDSECKCKKQADVLKAFRT